MAKQVGKAIVIDFNIETRHDSFVWGGYGLALYLAYENRVPDVLGTVLAETGLPAVVVKVALALAIYLVVSGQWRFVAKRVVYDEAHPAYWRRIWARRTSVIMAVAGGPVYLVAAALLVLTPMLLIERLWGVMPFDMRLASFPTLLVGCLASGFWSGWRAGRHWVLLACLGLVLSAVVLDGAFPGGAVGVLGRLGTIWPWVLAGAALSIIGGWAGARYFHMSMKRVPRTYVLPQEDV